MSDSMELIIKAANGSVADFKMSAQSNWTVAQVKNHIYRHYPTHPPLSSQRLIHSGRMLLDQQTLLEALPDLTNIIQPIIVHLVAYERSASAPVISQSSSTSVGSNNNTGTPPTRSRPQRLAASRQPSLTPVQEAADGGVTEGERGGAAPPVNDGRSPYPQQQPAPQNPWLRYRGTGQFQQQQQYHPPMANNVPAGGQLFMPVPGGYPGGFQPGMMAPGPGGFGAVFPAQFYQQYPFNQQMAQQYWGYYNQYGREPGAAGGDAMTNEGGEVVEDLDLQNLQEIANNADVDNQDVPMNAGGLGMMAGGGAQLRRHRDLVDYLYMLTMMGFLALIAYITGSFGRLMVFAGGIVFMMLNQRGWFSLRRRRQGRQRDEQNPLERVAQQQQQEEQQEREGEREGRVEVDGGQERGEESQGQMDEDDGETQESTPTEVSSDHQTTQQSPGSEEDEQGQEEVQVSVATRGQEATPLPPQQPLAAEEQPQPRPGVLTTILIFVTSFFTSLVPQQRPELQFN